MQRTETESNVERATEMEHFNGAESNRTKTVLITLFCWYLACMFVRFMCIAYTIYIGMNVFRFHLVGRAHVRVSSEAREAFVFCVWQRNCVQASLFSIMLLLCECVYCVVRNGKTLAWKIQCPIRIVRT